MNLQYAVPQRSVPINVKKRLEEILSVGRFMRTPVHRIVVAESSFKNVPTAIVNPIPILCINGEDFPIFKEKRTSVKVNVKEAESVLSFYNNFYSNLNSVVSRRRLSKKLTLSYFLTELKRIRACLRDKIGRINLVEGGLLKVEFPARVFVPAPGVRSLNLGHDSEYGCDAAKCPSFWKGIRLKGTSMFLEPYGDELPYFRPMFNHPHLVSGEECWGGAPTRRLVLGNILSGNFFRLLCIVNELVSFYHGGSWNSYPEEIPSSAVIR